MSYFVFFVELGPKFLFKQKTAYEIRISDWSSDVCSSDLLGRLVRPVVAAGGRDHARRAGADRPMALVFAAFAAETIARKVKAGARHAVVNEFRRMIMQRRHTGAANGMARSKMRNGRNKWPLT